MPRDMIITNGDCAAGCLKVSFPDVCPILPWRDILHEGPVPHTSSHRELSRIRGQHILANQWSGVALQPEEVFAERDDILERHDQFDFVSLWFEHDLYDQLQLIQILDWFAHGTRSQGSLKLVQADDYLGEQTPAEVTRFADRAVSVASEHFAVATRAWAALTQPTPEVWARLLHADLSALPFLRAAVARLLEELPAPTTGLNRTEANILAGIEPGGRTMVEILELTWAVEEPRFLGDWSVFRTIDELGGVAEPMIAGVNGGPFGLDADFAQRRRIYLESVPALTPFGREVLAGRADHAAVNRIDRWIGGCHVTNANLWRWDNLGHRLIPSR